jgi:KUP system potassium uptake protein
MQTDNKKRILSLSLTALGVVYGDIGTSPLYALRESLHGLPITPDNVLGVLSLIFWSLILVISTRYLTVFLRADNNGEGGVLALLALLKRPDKKSFKFLLCIGVLGGGLLLGDGMLTPAISVISAVEGLNVITPTFSHWVLPVTCIILLALFLLQRVGTTKIGWSFGPILLIWFVIIGILGLIKIIHNPNVISAINPYYGFEFFRQNGWVGYALLGGVFLVITGAEALYADLGHFGRTPIRIGWYAVALPALLLNYFGQGAYLLQASTAIVNPFYAIAPSWFAFPLLLIATIATIIASQAIISASFSLAKQAVLLNVSPRLSIIQTSEEERGQIYVPKINLILAIGTLTLVIIFKNSTAIAGMYGLAVNLVMIIVAILVISVAYQIWRWSIAKIIRVFSIFMLIDLAFLGANLHKFILGGWIPILFALICATIMMTWHKGLELLRSSYYMNKLDLKDIIQKLDHSRLYLLPKSTAIYITDPNDPSGGSFLHYLKLSHVMPEHILIVSIAIDNSPFVSDKKHYELNVLMDGCYQLILHFGFMQTIDIPKTLAMGKRMAIFPFELNLDSATFLIEAININITKKKYPRLFHWQKRLFSFLLRNSALELDFLKLPYNRTIMIGTYCEI